ncbi:transcriptional regulator [Rhodococcus jostii RHA1] [Mycobacterium shimoidei]|uniref:Transcriptional regulator [Rhodococcus jostii RHA1] n=1 Tax=Mycobacterium shimoidei TaxID=29313 RepID=A0A375YTY6_MYCSH|nr:TetR/AcrR family transcriptional regulator [Mycobacterium shimoidei]SRX92384.1 transcriptional regulator [Rhodococcus jostii RHA1] [Mycobacterium shimoidei]
MTTARAQSAALARRRPKDRKTQIARAAAEAFSALGYHAVSMEAIAAMVGISAPALYRHYSGKYDLFRGAVLTLGQQLVDCTDLTEIETPQSDPATTLDRLVDSLIEVTLVNRESGGLYRWQARYLRGEDESTLKDQLRLVNHRIQRPLLAIRPTLTSSQRWMLSSGLLSVIGSTVDHRVRLAPDEIRSVLRGAASAVLAAQLPHPDDTIARPPSWRIFTPNAGVYEALLDASMVLFSRHGYFETSMAQIASAVGIPVSGIYRYFSGKGEILSTGLRRAADRVSGHLSAIAADITEPGRMLTVLVEVFVATSFANPELASIYYTERVNLNWTDQELLRNVQRSTIDSWVRLLTQARPELPTTHARFLVHAAMALVVDLGRLVNYELTADNSAYPQACVRKLMQATLFGCCE